MKANLLASEAGSAINKVERLRRLADYTGDPISGEDAAWAVEQASSFVALLSQTLAPT